MKRIILDNEEKNRILEMHGFLKENEQKLSDEEILQNALKNGCIAKYKWFKPDAKPIRKTKSGKSIIYGTGVTSQTIFYFYSDMTIVNQKTGKKAKWECPELQTVKPNESEKPTQLDQNQLKVLEIIAKDNWFDKPKPTDVEIDQNLFQKMDLTNPTPDADWAKQYSKYFTKDKFPKGFFVYKKTETEPKVPTGPTVNRVKVSLESCRTAVDVLYDEMTSPTSVEISNQDLMNYIKTVKQCAEPLNRKSFLNFQYNKKLKKIADRYGITL